jgi:hypothetical protein
MTLADPAREKWIDHEFLYRALRHVEIKRGVLIPRKPDTPFVADLMLSAFEMWRGGNAGRSIPLAVHLVRSSGVFGVLQTAPGRARALCCAPAAAMRL